MHLYYKSSTYGFPRPPACCFFCALFGNGPYRWISAQRHAGKRNREQITVEQKFISGFQRSRTPPETGTGTQVWAKTDTKSGRNCRYTVFFPNFAGRTSNVNQIYDQTQDKHHPPGGHCSRYGHAIPWQGTEPHCADLVHL